MKKPLQNFARNARRNMTAAEEKLWYHLRTEIAVQKTHFRRQVIFKNYIIDFCCHASRLVIEVDGATHSTDQEIRDDEKRTRDLNASGYRVLRFTNDDVLTSIESVIDTIYIALQETPDVISEVERVQNRKRRPKNKAALHTPTPYPSPQGGGENKIATADNGPSFPSPLEGEGQGGG